MISFRHARTKIVATMSNGTTTVIVPNSTVIPVGTGDAVSFEGAFNSYAKALVALAPNVELEEHLDEIFEDHDGGDPEGIDPIDTGNLINAESWGWTKGTDRWWIVPLGFQSAAVPLSSTSLWMADSMDGGSVSAASLYTPEAALSWSSDSEGIADWFDITYFPDPAVVAVETFGAVYGGFFEWVRLCPCCDDEGWVAQIRADETLAPGAEQKGWNLVWEPCPEHAGGCEFTDIDGHHAEWTGTRWNTSRPQH